MKYVRLVLIVSLLALPLVFMEARPASATPCSEDIAKFCRSVKPGGGRIADCLQGHEQELSPACKEHRDILQRKARKAPPECQDDVERFCMDVRPVDRRIVRCLLQSEAALSGECRQKLNEGK